MRRTPLLIGIGLLLLAGGCRTSGESARATAEAFLDAHYVVIDLDTSRRLCSGLARRKVDKEVELTAAVAIDRETRKPRISYRLRTAREDEQLGQYAYQLTIRAAGFEPFHKLVTLTVRRGEQGWTVTNYNESDPPG